MTVFFVQYDHLPAFLHVAVVDETSLFQFYSFQFRIVGKDALQRNGNVFLAEGEDGVALADAGSGGDDFIGECLCGKLKIAFRSARVFGLSFSPLNGFDVYPG